MANACAKAEEKEQQMDEKVNKVLEEVMKLEGISPFEALEVATILITEEHKLHIFYQAHSNLKKQYVLDLLKKKWKWSSKNTWVEMSLVVEFVVCACRLLVEYLNTVLQIAILILFRLERCWVLSRKSCFNVCLS